MSTTTTNTNQELWTKPTARIAKLFCAASIRGSIHVNGNHVRLTAPMSEHLKATQRIQGLLLSADHDITMSYHTDNAGHITPIGTITYELFTSNVSTDAKTKFESLFI